MSTEGLNPIDNHEDVIDSRDVIARLEHLESEDADDLDDDEVEELHSLKALETDAGGASDWRYGETLIRDSYFKTYAIEMAEEIGAIPSEYTWPTSCIDWGQAARELQMDYTSVEFGEAIYWIRW